MRKKQFIPLETHLFNALFPQDLLIASCGIEVFPLATSVQKFVTLVGTLFICFFIFRFEELFSYAFFPSDIFPISHIFLFTSLLSMKFKLIGCCEAESSFIATLSYTVGQQ